MRPPVAETIERERKNVAQALGGLHYRSDDLSAVERSQAIGPFLPLDPSCTTVWKMEPNQRDLVCGELVQKRAARPGGELLALIRS